MRLDWAKLRWNLALPVILSLVSHVTRLFRDLRRNRCVHFMGRPFTWTQVNWKDQRGGLLRPVSQDRGTEPAFP